MRSNSTVDFPVGAAASEQAETNSSAGNVHNIPIYKDSNLQRLKVVGFHAFLENSLQRKVSEYTLNPLTKLGDNFGAVLQALEVKLLVANDSNQVETMHLVSKLVKSDAFTHTDLAFTKEIHFFTDIIPAIHRFEEKENVPQTERLHNAFPQYFGSRISLNSNATKADNNAALLLENLKLSNYVNRDRSRRLKKDDIRATLKVLAKMHALGISMRRKQHETFNPKISPYFEAHGFSFITDDLENIVKEVHRVLTNYSETVLAAIKQQLQPAMAYALKKVPDDHTPYTTICHHDLWISNFMFKDDNTGTEELNQVKLLDFQLYRYESFANDLIYFLFISADVDDLRTNFESFIEYYHSKFTETLNHVDFPLDDYTYDKMWQEIKKTAKLQLIRILRIIKGQSGFFDESIPKSEQNDLIQYFIKQPASEIALNQWRCIVDIFIKNEFI